MNNAETLAAQVERFAQDQRNCALMQAARAGRVGAQSMADYLESIRCLLAATPVCLELAATTALERGLHELADHFAEKLAEERGHDTWAVAGLELLEKRYGVHPAPCNHAIRAVVEHLMSEIRRDPRTYLAYILFAEYFTVLLGGEWVEALSTCCGLPAEAFTAVTNHVELDVQHTEDGLEEIQRLAGDPELLPDLIRVVDVAAAHFERFYSDLAAAA